MECTNIQDEISRLAGLGYKSLCAHTSDESDKGDEGDEVDEEWFMETFKDDEAALRYKYIRTPLIRFHLIQHTLRVRRGGMVLQCTPWCSDGYLKTEMTWRPNCSLSS